MFIRRKTYEKRLRQAYRDGQDHMADLLGKMTKTAIGEFPSSSSNTGLYVHSAVKPDIPKVFTDAFEGET